jgi:hypothetical protein
LNSYGSEQANDHGSHYLWLADKLVVEPHVASTLVAAVSTNHEGAMIDWTIIGSWIILFSFFLIIMLTTTTFTIPLLYANASSLSCTI